MLEFKLLLILMTANGIPIVLRRCLGNTLSQPIDSGFIFKGQPLLGYSKTWRGLFSGIISATGIAFLLGFSLLFGIAFAALSLLGDLLSSFIKRRLKRPPSSQCIGIDQIPETFLPLLVGAYWLDYGFYTVTIVTIAFFIINIFIQTVLTLLENNYPPN